MRNLKSAFACAICKKEFYNPSLLIKHVEVRHPNSSRQFSTIKNESLRSTKSNFRNVTLEKLSTLKTNDDQNDEKSFEFVSINDSENGTNIMETDKKSDSSNKETEAINFEIDDLKEPFETNQNTDFSPSNNQSNQNVSIEKVSAKEAAEFETLEYGNFTFQIIT